VVALAIEAVDEALVLGSKGGVAPEKILEVLSGGLAANKVMEEKGTRSWNTTSIRAARSSSTART
jgi:3-hydroxyisobutyrate dehydrogenase-like beta-hydroxyacid dehydrogenase